MSSGRQRGMQPHVARALEGAGEPASAQIAHCLRCGAALYFGCNQLGQMVESCPNGHTRLHPGGPMVTKDRRIQESGATKDGETLRGTRAKDLQTGKRKDR